MKKQTSRSGQTKKAGKHHKGKLEPVESSIKKAFGGLKEITLDRIVVRAKF